MTRWPFLALALLAGCANLPATLRPATDLETRAIGAVRAAWAASGRDSPECGALDRAEVYTAPQADVASWCARDGETWIDSCAGTVQRHPWSPLAATIYVREDVDADRHLRLVQHEAAHVLRGCAWVESGRSVDVLRLGSTEQCMVRYPMDPLHCDERLWRAILADAWERMR